MAGTTVWAVSEAGKAPAACRGDPAVIPLPRALAVPPGSPRDAGAAPAELCAGCSAPALNKPLVTRHLLTEDTLCASRTAWQRSSGLGDGIWFCREGAAGGHSGLTRAGAAGGRLRRPAAPSAPAPPGERGQDFIQVEERRVACVTPGREGRERHAAASFAAELREAPLCRVPLETAGDSSRHQPTPRCKHPALVRGKETPRKLLLLCSSKQKRLGSPGCGSALAGVRLSPRSP